MPRTIHLDTPIHGFCMNCALEGEPASVVSKEFSSSEDGNDFIARLEGTSTYFAEAFQSPLVRISQVDNFLGSRFAYFAAMRFANDYQNPSGSSRRSHASFPGACS